MPTLDERINILEQLVLDIERRTRTVPPHASQHELAGTDPIRISVQNSGTYLNRYRTVNFGTGLTATEDPANKRVTVALADDSVITLLTPELESASWNGSSHSTTVATPIDLSSVFGAPAGIRAVFVKIGIRDSGSASGSGIYFQVGPGEYNPDAVRVDIDGVPNDHWRHCSGICPCNNDGDIYYELGASGTSTLDVYLRIWAYII
jgi:hypothetical protein